MHKKMHKKLKDLNINIVEVEQISMTNLQFILVGEMGMTIDQAERIVQLMRNI